MRHFATLPYRRKRTLYFAASLVGVVVSFGIVPSAANSVTIGNPVLLATDSGGPIEPYHLNASRIIYQGTEGQQAALIAVDTEDGGNRSVLMLSDDQTFARPSPDGSNRLRPERDLYARNADGTGTPIQLTVAGELGGPPSWSPDSSRLAYQAGYSNPEIYVVSVSGGTPADVSNGPAFDFQPSFSTDGTRVVYGSSRGGSGGSELYCTSADGTGLTAPLTPIDGASVNTHRASLRMGRRSSSVRTGNLHLSSTRRAGCRAFSRRRVEMSTIFRGHLTVPRSRSPLVISASVKDIYVMNAEAA